jgi:hypothetical protein
VHATLSTEGIHRPCGSKCATFEVVRACGLLARKFLKWYDCLHYFPIGVYGQLFNRAATRGENWSDGGRYEGGLEFLNMKYSSTRLIHGPPFAFISGVPIKNPATVAGSQSIG